MKQPKEKIHGIKDCHIPTTNGTQMKNKIDCKTCTHLIDCDQPHDPWGMKLQTRGEETGWCMAVWDQVKEPKSISVYSFPAGEMIDKVVPKRTRRPDVYMMVAGLYLRPKYKRKSPAEIARTLSLPVGRVYQICRQIRRQLLRKGLKRD